MAEQVVELAPGESKLVSFEATPHEAKTYQVSVNGLVGSFTAAAPVAVLEITSVNKVNVGEAYYLFAVYCKISNPANITLSTSIRCYGKRDCEERVFERLWTEDYPDVWYPLTLVPGETQIIISPAIARSLINPLAGYQNFPTHYYTGDICGPTYFWLEDDKGNKSAIFTLP